MLFVSTDEERERSTTSRPAFEATVAPITGCTPERDYVWEHQDLEALGQGQTGTWVTPAPVNHQTRARLRAGEKVW